MTSGTSSSVWLTQPPVLKGQLFQDELKAHPQYRALLEFVSVSPAAERCVLFGQRAELRDRCRESKQAQALIHRAQVDAWSVIQRPCSAVNEESIMDPETDRAYNRNKGIRQSFRLGLKCIQMQKLTINICDNTNISQFDSDLESIRHKFIWKYFKYTSGKK